MEWINFIKDNWEPIMAALGCFYAFATAVAAITPSDKDNTWLEKIGAIADKFGLKLKGK